MQVLVVDDSAVVRQVMIAMLSPAGIDVVVANDPIIAMSKLERIRPDVILLDVEMPRMDGITFLHQLMTTTPLPVVICSSLAGRETEVAMRALREGAVAVVEKPKIGLRESLEEMSSSLIETLKEAAHARVNLVSRPTPPHAPAAAAGAPDTPGFGVLGWKVALPFAQTTDKVIVIGASIGGTEAVRFLLENLPVDIPGIVIAQHMPQAFTAPFARQLNAACKLDVKEAEDGDRIINGRVLIAPGNRHTMVRRSGAHYVVEVGDGAPVCRHRPSVDVLFQSAATAAGANAVGVILTGMGEDGADGLLEMKNRGARTFAQDEMTSVVYGMAKEAVARGAVDNRHILPLDQIPGALLWGSGR